MIIFGTVCIDRIYRLAALPRPGGFVEVESELDSLGGEAANTASYLKTWGAIAQLSPNPVGNDKDGAALNAMLSNAGFDKTHIAPGFTTPVCEILVTPDGERTMIGKGFSTLSDAIVAVTNMKAGEWFTADPNFGGAARNAVRDAQSARMRTYLMDFYQPTDEPLIDKCEVWQSSTDWVGTRGDNEGNLNWCRDAQSRHKNTSFCITDGANGVLYSDANGNSAHIPAPHCGTVVDATGSGDAFRAGMLYGLGMDWDFEKCIRFGSAAGCLNCLTLGATRGIPSLDKVLELANA